MKKLKKDNGNTIYFNMTNQTIIVLSTLVFLIQSIALSLKYTNQDAVSHQMLLIGAAIMAIPIVLLGVKYKQYLTPVRIKKVIIKRKKRN